MKHINGVYKKLAFLQNILLERIAQELKESTFYSYTLPGAFPNSVENPFEKIITDEINSIEDLDLRGITYKALFRLKGLHESFSLVDYSTGQKKFNTESTFCEMYPELKDSRKYEVLSTTLLEESERTNNKAEVNIEESIKNARALEEAVIKKTKAEQEISSKFYSDVEVAIKNRDLSLLAFLISSAPSYDLKVLEKCVAAGWKEGFFLIFSTTQFELKEIEFHDKFGGRIISLFEDLNEKLQKVVAQKQKFSVDDVSKRKKVLSKYQEALNKEILLDFEKQPDLLYKEAADKLEKILENNPKLYVRKVNLADFVMRNPSNDEYSGIINEIFAAISVDNEDTYIEHLFSLNNKFVTSALLHSLSLTAREISDLKDRFRIKGHSESLRGLAQIYPQLFAQSQSVISDLKDAVISNNIKTLEALFEIYSKNLIDVKWLIHTELTKPRSYPYGGYALINMFVDHLLNRPEAIKFFVEKVDPGYTKYLHSVIDLLPVSSAKDDVYLSEYKKADQLRNNRIEQIQASSHRYSSLVDISASLNIKGDITNLFNSKRPKVLEDVQQYFDSMDKMKVSRDEIVANISLDVYQLSMDSKKASEYILSCKEHSDGALEKFINTLANANNLENTCKRVSNIHSNLSDEKKAEFLTTIQERKVFSKYEISQLILNKNNVCRVFQDLYQDNSTAEFKKLLNEKAKSLTLDQTAKLLADKDVVEKLLEIFDEKEFDEFLENAKVHDAFEKVQANEYLVTLQNLKKIGDKYQLAHLNAFKEGLFDDVVTHIASQFVSTDLTNLKPLFDESIQCFGKKDFEDEFVKLFEGRLPQILQNSQDTGLLEKLIKNSEILQNKKITKIVDDEIAKHLEQTDFNRLIKADWNDIDIFKKCLSNVSLRDIDEKVQTIDFVEYKRYLDSQVASKNNLADKIDELVKFANKSKALLSRCGQGTEAEKRLVRFNKEIVDIAVKELSDSIKNINPNYNNNNQQMFWQPQVPYTNPAYQNLPALLAALGVDQSFDKSTMFEQIAKKGLALPKLTRANSQQFLSYQIGNTGVYDLRDKFQAGGLSAQINAKADEFERKWQEHTLPAKMLLINGQLVRCYNFSSSFHDPVMNQQTNYTPKDVLKGKVKNSVYYRMYAANLTDTYQTAIGISLSVIGLAALIYFAGPKFWNYCYNSQHKNFLIIHSVMPSMEQIYFHAKVGSSLTTGFIGLISVPLIAFPTLGIAELVRPSHRAPYYRHFNENIALALCITGVGIGVGGYFLGPKIFNYFYEKSIANVLNTYANLPEAAAFHAKIFTYSMTTMLSVGALSPIGLVSVVASQNIAGVIMPKSFKISDLNMSQDSYFAQAA